MKTYGRFLSELLDDLVMALAEAENNEWHHSEMATLEGQCYNRLCTWINEVTRRQAIPTFVISIASLAAHS